MHEVTSHRPRRRGRPAATAAATVAAIAIAACGATSPSSQDPAPAQIGHHSMPLGAMYQGPGFEVHYPASWPKPLPPTAPAGLGGVSGMAAGGGAAGWDAHVTEHPNETINMAISDDVTNIQVDRSDGTVRDVAARAHLVNVPGARQADELVETARTKGGPWRYLDLIVITRAGGMIDLEAWRHGSNDFDPDAVIASIKLT